MCCLVNITLKVDNGRTQYASKTAVILFSVNFLLKAKALRAVTVNSSVHLNASAGDQSDTGEISSHIFIVCSAHRSVSVHLVDKRCVCACVCAVPAVNFKHVRTANTGVKTQPLSDLPLIGGLHRAMQRRRGSRGTPTGSRLLQ